MVLRRKVGTVAMSERIRLLLVEPHRHPRLVEVEHTLENLQKLVGGYIAASYPWEDPVGLVYDDEGKFKEDREANRILEDYDVLVGTFFLSGLGRENFISIPDGLALKYAEKFWMPETLLRMPDGLMVLREDDGTKPGEKFLQEVEVMAQEEGE